MNYEIINRDDIFKYAQENFDTQPEYLWNKFPDYAVLRHSNNRKWYAVILYVSKEKLGLKGQEPIDILVLKCNPIMVGSLLKNEGYMPAYHMNKEHWITVLLDGTVSKDEIFNLLCLSFDLTSCKK